MKLERIHIPLPAGAYGIGQRSPQQTLPAGKVDATGDHSQKRRQNTPHPGRNGKPSAGLATTLDATSSTDIAPNGEHDLEREGGLDITV